jgi:hypothetical protein
MLKHHSNLGRSGLRGAVRLNNHRRVDGPWILEDDNNDEDDKKELLPEESCE